METTYALSILLVDDEPSNLGALSACLDALDLLDPEPLALAIGDLMMPA